MPSTASDTTCRLCASTATRLIGRVQGFSYRECLNCAFTFCPNIRQQDVAPLYESGERDVDAGAPEVGWADPSFLDPALIRLGGSISKPLTILDFGSGQSLVPDLLRDQGHRVVAVDILPPRHPHQDRLTGDLLDSRLPQKTFDLVYSFQVFEHLPEPMPYIFELLRLVRDDGLVLIHTDMETQERNTAGFENWWYVTPPDHCCFYRHKTFEVVLSGMQHGLYYRDDKSVIIGSNRN